MAGYDWGAGNVQRAVQKTGYADFWELYKRNNLPAETKNYVPEILAAIIIANHPTQYGFDDVTLDPPVLTDTVTVNYQVDLRLVADLTGAPVDELVALNPSLLRMITPPDTSFDLHLPAGTATLFAQRIAAIPEGKRNGWRYHRVVAGDTLASVAREYRVTVAELAAANQLGESDGVTSLEALVVPASPAASAAPSARTSLYTVRKGETLVTIADRFGVSLNQLRRWNNISGIKVEQGRRLHVADPSSAPRAASRGRHRGASRANAETLEAAPAKGSTRNPASSRSRKRRGASAAEKAPARRSEAGSGAKKSGTTSAKQSHSRKRGASSKTHSEK
jgi:membrane-bound lytic murein transglycosylase D